MAKKKVKYGAQGIADLPNDKPVVYKILTPGGKPNYVGSAKRGRVQDRVKEHLGEIPGGMVQVQQYGSVADAQKAEARAIKRDQPKYNER